VDKQSAHHTDLYLKTHDITNILMCNTSMFELYEILLRFTNIKKM